MKLPLQCNVMLMKCFYLFFKFPLSNRIELRKDGVRRRNTSGPRPLSAINDVAFDAFDLLGIEKGETGQEKSYGYLLIPSRQPKEKKNPFGTQMDSNIDLTGPHALKMYNATRLDILLILIELLI